MKTIFLHGFSGDGSSLRPFVEAVGLPQSFAIDLPAFGSNARQYEPTWQGYTEATMATIRDTAGPGPYRLIGHSHGAMVAFALARQFPDDIHQIILICPVASGTNLGRAFLRANSVMRRVLGDRATLRLHRARPMVDVVTRVGKQPDWPDEAYTRLKYIRRQESARYSGAMLDVLKLIPSFRAQYNDVIITIPSGLIFAYNDLLVSRNDVSWYEHHTLNADMAWCRGGHVAPVIFPAELASIIRKMVL